MMLLDTHVVIWLALEPHHLSREAATLIQQADSGELAIGAPTLYEVARLIVRGRVVPNEPVESFIRAMASRFRVFPLTTHIAVIAAQLPTTFPSDPFDRIIAATAIAEDVPLITADRNILSSGALRTIW